MSAQHIPEDLLDEYALKKLVPSMARVIEEHLLICPECCNRLTQIDALIAVLRHALALQN